MVVYSSYCLTSRHCFCICPCPKAVSWTGSWTDCVKGPRAGIRKKSHQRSSDSQRYITGKRKRATILPVQCATTKFFLLQSTYLASVTTPSYSLLLIYANVLKKCLLGFSKLAGLASVLVVLRLEWMSSISPFRYFVVTVSFC